MRWLGSSSLLFVVLRNNTDISCGLHAHKLHFPRLVLREGTHREVCQHVLLPRNRRCHAFGNSRVAGNLLTAAHPENAARSNTPEAVFRRSIEKRQTAMNLKTRTLETRILVT